MICCVSSRNRIANKVKKMNRASILDVVKKDMSMVGVSEEDPAGRVMELEDWLWQPQEKTYLVCDNAQSVCF